MSQADAAQPALTRRTPLKRMWWPIAAVLLAVAGMIAVPLLSDRFDRGTRLSISFGLAVLAFIAVAAWYFFSSGASGRARAVAAVLLAGILAGGAASVRRVEFSGDMVPTFDFRWQTDRSVALEEHRAEQRKAGGPADGPQLPQIGIQPRPGDVLEFRGPRRDGVITGGPKLARDWAKQPPELLWKQPVGGGYGSFVLVDGTLATIEQRRDQEAIVAYDAASGQERWAHSYPALFSEVAGGDGPRATPTFHEGKLYALGATGMLTCLDFVTGKPLWSVDILKDNGSGNLDWAMSGSPLVYDDVVLVNPGNQKGTADSRSIVAYGLADGKRRFAGGETKASYASPMLVTLAGTRQVLIFDGVGLAGHDAGDGRSLWSAPWKSDFDINASQPIVLPNDEVLISSASGSALVKIEQADGPWSAKELWRVRRFKCGYANPVAYQGHAYGLDENLLACIELASGKLKWKARDGQFGHGQTLLSGDVILVLGEAGELALVEANSERYVELGRIQAVEGKTWNVPLLVGRRIYVRNHLEMAAYELPVEAEATGP